MSRPAFVPTLLQWVMVALSPGVKVAGHETDHMLSAILMYINSQNTAVYSGISYTQFHGVTQEKTQTTTAATSRTTETSYRSIH